MKRMLSVMLAAALLLIGIPYTATAAATPTLSVDCAETAAGEIFTVDVCITDNPGLNKMKMWVCFDTTVLEPQFTNQNKKDIIGDEFKTANLSVDVKDSYVELSWSATVRNSGVIATLTFKAMTAPRVSTLRVEYDSKFTSKSCNVSDGVIGIGVPVPGDADSDNAITMKDAGTLQRHLTGWDVSMNTTSADVWGDGKLNNKDLAMLQRYMAGWEDTKLDASTVDVPADSAIVLPEIGSDIDVSKLKNRLVVGDAFVLGQTVFLKVHNKTTNWITEETNYIQYTCYDAAGTALGSAKTLYIGVIDTKKNPQKVFVLDTLPEGTAKVKITESKITYWTEWS